MTGEDVLLIRELYGLSRARFGEILGVAERTVIRWEQSETRPSVEMQAELRRMRQVIVAAPAVKLPERLTAQSTQACLEAFARRQDEALARFMSDEGQGGLDRMHRMDRI